MANSNSSAIFQNVQEKLTEAYRQFGSGPNNQLGMPDHLRSVARKFAQVKEQVGQLEAAAYKAANSWQKRINGNTSSNASVTGGRKTRKNRR